MPTVVIQPLGRVDDGVLAAVGKALRLRFGVRARSATRVARLPTSAYRPRRDQYRADELLDAVDARVKDAECVVGVTAADIFTPGMNFLFGLSYQGRGSSVLSTARLGDDDGVPSSKTITAQRAAKLAVHEFGHALGLGHCRTARCVMTYSDHVDALDSESDRLCRKCQSRLRKLLQERWAST